MTQANLTEAKDFLDSVAVAINNGDITFEQAARTYSEDEQTKFNGGQMSNFQSGNSRFEVSSLDRGLFSVIHNMDEGEVSEASFYQTRDQKEAFRIVRMDKRFEPHKANVDIDFTRIKGFALQGKQNRIIAEWKEEKLLETFVKINFGYYSCESKLTDWNSNRDD